MAPHQAENDSVESPSIESPAEAIEEALSRRIQLPVPDADNITVLTRELPNKPILPWHRFDSPWLQHQDASEDEGSEGDASDADVRDAGSDERVFADLPSGDAASGDLPSGDSASGDLRTVGSDAEADVASDGPTEVSGERDAVAETVNPEAPMLVDVQRSEEAIINGSEDATINESLSGNKSLSGQMMVTDRHSSTDEEGDRPALSPTPRPMNLYNPAYDESGDDGSRDDNSRASKDDERLDSESSPLDY